MIDVLSVQAEDEICCGAIRYAWKGAAFLSRIEAEYAVRQLWRKVAGSAGWSGVPIIRIPSIDTLSAQSCVLASCSEVPLACLGDFLPRGPREGREGQLPALCWFTGRPMIFSSLEEDFPMDLVAALFIFQSKWETCRYSLERDKWGNVLERATQPFRQGFSERPILDEWAAVLEQWIRMARPSWRPQLEPFVILPTHDIDSLFRYQSWASIPRRMVGAAIRERNPLSAVRVGAEACYALHEGNQEDPSIRIIRDLARRDAELGAQGIFFFMSAPRGMYDSGYRMDAPVVQVLLKRIVDGGHRIGWHPGYDSAEDRDSFFRQATRMEQIFQGATANVRMHYLRWRKTTMEWQEALGVKNDHSWGNNDDIGFSCGTARPFKGWDLSLNRESSVTETPLLVQDGAFDQLLAKDKEIAIAKLQKMLDKTKSHAGVFSFLIHNNTHYAHRDYRSMADVMYGVIGGARAQTNGMSRSV